MACTLGRNLLGCLPPSSDRKHGCWEAPSSHGIMAGESRYPALSTARGGGRGRLATAPSTLVLHTLQAGTERGEQPPGRGRAQVSVAPIPRGCPDAGCLLWGPRRGRAPSCRALRASPPPTVWRAQWLPTAPSPSLAPPGVLTREAPSAKTGRRWEVLSKSGWGPQLRVWGHPIHRTSVPRERGGQGVRCSKAREQTGMPRLPAQPDCPLLKSCPR